MIWNVICILVSIFLIMLGMIIFSFMGKLFFELLDEMIDQYRNFKDNLKND